MGEEIAPRNNAGVKARAYCVDIASGFLAAFFVAPAITIVDQGLYLPLLISKNVL